MLNPLPPQLIWLDTINDRRNSGFQELYDLVDQNIRDLVSPSARCDNRRASSGAKSVCNAAMLGSFLKETSARQLYPTPSLPVENLALTKLAAKLRDIRVGSLCDLNEHRSLDEPVFSENWKRTGHGLNACIASDVGRIREDIEGLELFAFQRDVDDRSLSIRGQ
jgi:hypothetical protein